MSVIRTLVFAGLATIIQAYTQPTNATWGSLLTPDTTHPVTQGESFTVTWDPSGHSTDGVTVSLVLCKGPSTNCVPQSAAIVEGVPASQKSYNWAVPCSLTPGVEATETGYGMLIIVDGTGEFQYSTQFSVLANPTCAASSSSSAVSSPASAASSSASSGASTSQSSASAPSSSNVESSSSAAAASSSASSASAKTTASTIVTSVTSVSGSALTTHMPVPTSAITSATASASTSKPVSTFAGAAPQVTSGAVGVFAAAALAILAL